MIYTILKPILWVLFKLGLRLNVEGTENIPQEGPLVIASNHLSLLDPPVIGVAATRKVHFMAKQELFVPILGDIYKALGAFPVRRGGADRAAIKHGIDILKDNKVLAIFPEGTRSLGGEKFLPFKSGAKVLVTLRSYKSGNNEVIKGCQTINYSDFQQEIHNLCIK